MQIRTAGMILTSVASLGLTMMPALAQPAATAMEQVLGRASDSLSVVEPAVAPLSSPVPAADHNVISQPEVCRIRSDDECIHAAAACLKVRSIAGLYSVDWRAGAPAVVRVQQGMSDAQEKGARGCATDLQQCLSGKC